MKIVIATPLYPPDVAEPAPYVKNLAGRLEDGHDVTIVLYGRLPETVPGVSFVSVNKQDLLPIRLARYLVALYRATRKADVLYVMNGPSVELIAGILTIFTRTPMFVHLGDDDANKWIERKPLLRFIKQFVIKRASARIDTLPPQQPEILPFGEYPVAAFATYEQTWNAHIEELETLFQKI